MKASFVIATYNRVSDLERCLDSILRQQDCELEIIVVDDASSDHTCSLVREKYGPCVLLIERDSNRGSIRNRNYGASLAQGDILFLIDDDTELPGEQTVRETLEEFNEPCVGAVAIPYLQDGVLHHTASVTTSDRFIAASYVGCACAVLRNVFLELGGYEEFFHHGAEEDDFCIRMLNAGLYCVIGTVSSPMVHYESPARNFFNWDYYPRRSSILYIWKNCPSVYLLPNLFLTTVRGFLHCFRVKRFRGNLCGLFDGYRGIVCSMFGKGCKRIPVQRIVYRLSVQLRKNSMGMSAVKLVAKATDNR